LRIEYSGGFTVKISVCIALYNGEKYLHRQLISILDQIKSDDEVIIVNDSSTDSSIKIIDEISDTRIFVFNNNSNIGVIKTFEKALNLSTGDIIFLSDQDDIWLPNKVSKIIEVFNLNPEITLVTSDAQVIDGDGNFLVNSYLLFTKRRFTSNPILNLIKNTHLGCTLSFRREILDMFLPFPSDIPMHDIWIGLVNGIYGKTYFIEESLIQYRRHGSNISSSNRSNLFKIVSWRFILCKNLIFMLLGGGIKK
jgi:glycosyltransferase involved in cell wall biosynthesis